MSLERVIPAGPPGPPELFYTGLRLADSTSPRRPYVICNFVSSLDGKATAEGRTGPLSDAADRRVFHLLRTQVDAVLVGTGTLRVERYGPLIKDERLASIRIAEGRSSAPLAVLVSRSGNVPFDIPLFSDPASVVVLYVSKGETPTPRCSATVHVHSIGSADLAAVMRSLHADHGVCSVLCEGGPTLFNSLLAEDLVDELFLTLAPTLVGVSELGVTAGEALAPACHMELARVLAHDNELFLRYARRRGLGERSLP